MENKRIRNSKHETLHIFLIFLKKIKKNKKRKSINSQKNKKVL